MPGPQGWYSQELGEEMCFGKVGGELLSSTQSLSLHQSLLVLDILLLHSPVENPIPTLGAKVGACLPACFPDSALFLDSSFQQTEHRLTLRTSPLRRGGRPHLGKLLAALPAHPHRTQLPRGWVQEASSPGPAMQPAGSAGHML